MESFFLELKVILETQKDILNQLYDTAREHSRALRQLNTEVLQSAVIKEEKLTAALRKYDREREKVAGAIAEKFCLPKDAVLSMFVEKAPPSIKEELNALLQHMGKTAAELAEVNEINLALTKQAMQVSQVVLRALGPRQNTVYTQDGRAREEAQPMSLVNKKI